MAMGHGSWVTKDDPFPSVVRSIRTVLVGVDDISAVRQTDAGGAPPGVQRAAVFPGLPAP